MSDNLERQVAEAVKDAVTPLYCGARHLPDRADIAGFLAPIIAAALRATAARAVFGGRETILLDRSKEWEHVEAAKAEAEAAGLAALKGGGRP